MTIKTEPKLLKRTLAVMIDYGLYLLFFVWLVKTYGVPNNEGGYTLNNDSKAWWIFFVWLIYFPISESITGRTFGKLILGLKVVTKNGNSISFGQAFKRHAFDVFDFFFFGIVAFITVKNTPDHQRLGDLWAKTIVIGGDHFDCSNCHAQSMLTANEMVRREFVCPTCKSIIKM